LPPCCRGRVRSTEVDGLVGKEGPAWEGGLGNPPGRPPEGLSMAGLDPGAEESKRPRRGQRLPPRTAARRAAARTFGCRRSGCSPRSECQSRPRERLRRAAEAQSHLPNVWNEKITGHARGDAEALTRDSTLPQNGAPRPQAAPVLGAASPRDLVSRIALRSRNSASFLGRKRLYVQGTAARG
jgi:hypothetical protein